MATFTERFSELVGKRGEMARLSKATGLSTGLLSNYKNGKYESSLPNAVSIADYFDVSLDWLAGREGFERDAHKRAGPALAPDESALVGSYRLMDDEQKGRYRDMAGTFVMASEKDGPGIARDVDRAGIAARR